MKRKSIIISLALVLTFLFCVPSFAATVCKIGSKAYSSLQEAVDNVGNGQTIKLSKKISTNDMVVISPKSSVKSFTIDFNNKKYTYKGYDVAFELIGSYELTLKNVNLNTREAFHLVNMDQKAPLMIFENGKVLGAGPIIQNERDCAVVIKSGTFYNRSQIKPFASNDGKLAFEDGKYYGFVIENGGILRIYKGTFDTKISKNIFSRSHMIINHTGGDVYIEKGEFISRKNGAFVNYEGATLDFASGSVVENGTFWNKGTSNLTGGSFSPYKGYTGHLITNEGDMIISGAKINGPVEGVAMG